MKPLSNTEIEELLKPLTRGVGKPYIIDRDGNKRFVDALPPAVGGFVSDAPEGKRTYRPGDPDIIAYKDNK